MDVSDCEAYPLELDLVRGRHLRITWSDSRTSVIPLTELREACPCAECRAAREQRKLSPLVVVRPVADPSDFFSVRDAEIVGNYALRVTWKDGHEAGIYDFGLLRQLGSETDKVSQGGGQD